MKFLRPTSLIASLITSLTVTPVLCSFLLTPKNLLEKEEGWLSRKLKNLDRSILEKILNKPKLTMIFASVLLFISLSMLPFLGQNFLPEFNEGTVTVNVLAQPGISLEKSNELGTQAEKALWALKEAKIPARRTGRAEMDEHAEGVHYSEIDLDLGESHRSREEILGDIRAGLDKIEGIFYSVGQPISHRLDHLLSGVRAQIAVKIFGPDLTVLRAKAAEVFKTIKSIPGVVDLQIEQQSLVPQLKIQILRDEMARFGLPVGEITHTLEKALHGEVIGKVLEGQQVIDILFRMDDESRKNIEEISKIVIRTLPDGTSIKIEDIADIYESSGPNQINRENARRRLVISANTQGRDIQSVVEDIKVKISQSIQLPTDYEIEFDGQYESQKSANRTMFLLGILAILGVFILLYSHFKSTFIAFQIMLNIPMALIGSIFAVYFTSKTLSLASLVAFVTLCGIASRNGIMMISHYLHLMKEENYEFGKKLVIQGSIERLIPVLMTATTAILGLLPLALSAGEPGKEILHPLSIVIIGGLISSTLLDMVVTPAVFYKFGKKSAEKYLFEKQLRLKQKEELI